ncbi:MAG: host attachment protein [Zetaproteobacteria bacterium]|nr:MAG: host attachment protein [Zetaproteobacteria bacterium]
MTRIGVLVADKSRAKWYTSNQRKGPLHLEHSWDHPAARMPERELTTDLPGRAFDRRGGGRHAMGTEVSPKHHEAEQFAGQLAQALDHQRNTTPLTRIYVVAPPEFLGLLRKKIGAETAQLIAGEVPLGLSTAEAAEVRKHLPEYM